MLNHENLGEISSSGQQKYDIMMGTTQEKQNENILTNLNILVVGTFSPFIVETDHFNSLRFER